MVLHPSALASRFSFGRSGLNDNAIVGGGGVDCRHGRFCVREKRAAGAAEAFGGGSALNTYEVRRSRDKADNDEFLS